MYTAHTHAYRMSAVVSCGGQVGVADAGKLLLQRVHAMNLDGMIRVPMVSKKMNQLLHVGADW
jgi:hypothetical protein